MPRQAKDPGTAKTVVDEFGYTVLVPFFCRMCGAGYLTRLARSAHERRHNPDPSTHAGMRPLPEPPLGTTRHYDWCRRNKLPIPQVDRDAQAEYRRQKRSK